MENCESITTLADGTTICHKGLIPLPTLVTSDQVAYKTQTAETTQPAELPFTGPEALVPGILSGLLLLAAGVATLRKAAD